MTTTEDVNTTGSFLDSLNDEDLFAQLDNLASGGQTLDIPDTENVEPVATEDITANETVDEVQDDLPTEGTAETEDTTDSSSIVDTEPTADTSDSIESEVQVATEVDEGLQTFKDSFDSMVKVAGVEVPLVNDPAKVGEMQRQLYAMQGKIDKYQEVAPVLDSLKDSGILGDAQKLTMLIEASKGNPEALKMMMREHNVDPLKLDLDNIEEESVTGKVNEYVDSKETIALKDIYKDAQTRDIDKSFVDNVYNSWDEDSLRELTKSPENAEVILQHLESGAYDEINREVKVLERTDAGFRNQTSFDKYQHANQVIFDRETAKLQATQELQALAKQHVDTPAPQAVETVVPPKQEATDSTNERILAAQKASAQSAMRGEPETGTVTSTDDMSDQELSDFFYAQIT